MTQKEFDDEVNAAWSHGLTVEEYRDECKTQQYAVSIAEHVFNSEPDMCWTDLLTWAMMGEPVHVSMCYVKESCFEGTSPVTGDSSVCYCGCRQRKDAPKPKRRRKAVAK